MLVTRESSNSSSSSFCLGARRSKLKAGIFLSGDSYLSSFLLISVFVENGSSINIFFPLPMGEPVLESDLLDVKQSGILDDFILIARVPILFLWAEWGMIWGGWLGSFISFSDVSFLVFNLVISGSSLVFSFSIGLNKCKRLAWESKSPLISSW